MRRHEAIDVYKDPLLNRVVFAQAVDQTFVTVDRSGRNLHSLVVVLTVIDEEQSDFHGLAHGQLEPSEPVMAAIADEML